MKKNWYIIFAALCAAATVSCSKEIAQPSEEPAGPKAGEFLNPVTLTFTADPSTKVAISDKGVASWEEGDQIVILSFDSEGTARTSEAVTVDKETGSFTATVESSNTYYAVYPASATVALAKVSDVDNLTVTIPATQDGTLKHSIYYAAKTSATDKCFNFKAVSGIIKFEAADDYNKAQIRNVEATSTTHAFNGAATCTFDNGGNLTVTPIASKSTTHTISLDGSGTYYAAIVGNATNEFTFRFSKDDGATYEPGVFINKAVNFTPGKIKNCGNLTGKIHTDLYLSVDGTGDGLTEGTPAPYSAFISSDCLGDASLGYPYVEGLGAYNGVWNCMRRDGVTIHLAAGEYSSGFKIAGTGTPFIMTIQGTMAADTTKIGGLCTFSAYNEGGTKCTLNNIKFFGSTTGALSVTAGDYQLNGCVFQKNTTTNTVVIGSKSATDDNLKINFRNCLFTANTVPSYGVIKGVASSTGGVAGFHNCRFENNTATSGGGAVFGAADCQTAFLLNKCSFTGNKHSTKSGGYTVNMNNLSTRFAMNCCTVNAGVTAPYSNGAAITLKGQSVIANSTVWTSGKTGSKYYDFGKWGLVALGCHQDNNLPNGALVINSVIRQLGTDNVTTKYPAYYLHETYYQHLHSCLHSAIDLTVVERKHTVENTLKVTSFASPSAKTQVVDGITANYYTWNYTSTVGSASFTKPSKATVIEAIEKTGESADGAKDGFGKLFTTWLAEVDETAFTKDLIGTDRPEGGLCPGSVEQAN